MKEEVSGDSLNNQFPTVKGGIYTVIICNYLLHVGRPVNHDKPPLLEKKNKSICRPLFANALSLTHGGWSYCKCPQLPGQINGSTDQDLPSWPRFRVIWNLIQRWLRNKIMKKHHVVWHAKNIRV